VLQCHGETVDVGVTSKLTQRLVQDSILPSMSPSSDSLCGSSSQRCKTRVPGPTIEPYIMSSQIPYCGTCRQKRDAELEIQKGMKAARKKAKSKGKATGWGDGSDESDEDEDEWGGGLPGIMKVS